MNKKVSFFMASLFLGFLTFSSKAQDLTATMENLNLPNSSYWNGSTTASGTTFMSGQFIFSNNYSPDWGGYWANGWAYSTMTDTTTAGAGNMYSAIPGKGAEGSNTYLVGQQGAIASHRFSEFRFMDGVYITNSTYTALSMANGDMFAKKFGGITGNDPDWLKLSIQKWLDGTLYNEAIEVYLADFRFEDNSKDYILSSWKWVDLEELGKVDSLKFTLTSSDTSAWGMNTPAFFCIDNLSVLHMWETAIDDTKTLVQSTAYPNPTTEWITLDLPYNDTYTMTLTDNAGRTIIQEIHHQTTRAMIDVSPLESGIYILQISSNKETFTQKIIKE